jgi:hypothetical protein
VRAVVRVELLLDEPVERVHDGGVLVARRPLPNGPQSPLGKAHVEPVGWIAVCSRRVETGDEVCLL